MKSILIVYYSFSNSTRVMANEIAKQVDADIRELIPQKAYAFDYNTAAKEIRNEIVRGYCPVLLSGNESTSSYETIFIGTPNWFKSLAPPVLSFLRQHGLAGKTVVPFCTHGGGGFGEIEKRIAEECPSAMFLPGLAVNGTATAEEIASWLKEIKLIP